MAKTTGIMQVKSDHPLTDEESIAAAFPIVEKIWDEFLTAKSNQELGPDLKKSEALRADAGIDLRPDGYSYLWPAIQDEVIRCYSSLHLGYMGTINFEGATRFCFEAFRCVGIQLYQPIFLPVGVNYHVKTERSQWFS